MMPADSVGAALESAAERFAKAGIEEPYREAVVMLSRRLKCPPALVYVRRDERLGEYLSAGFQMDVQRRERREPAALISGQRAFFGRDFFVSRDTLVPRPETELLVEAVLPRLKAGMTVLDIGTGTGCIAVSLAAESPGARVVAVDISAEALAVAAKNAEKHAVSDRIEFLASDLYAQLGPAGGRYFDIIVSNPPYVSTQVIPTLEPELKFEPRIALDGGNDGLAVLTPLIAGSAAFLRPGGRLLVEIGFDQADRGAALMSKAGFQDVEVSKDYSGHDRILSGALIGSI
jgi:release factor glutamine methyltransferase